MFNCVKFAFLSLHSLFQDIIITLYCSGYVPSAVPGRLDLLGGGGGGDGGQRKKLQGGGGGGGGGGENERLRNNLQGGCRGMLPRKILNYRISEMGFYRLY